jgi:AcrR family transcriptional regulator
MPYPSQIDHDAIVDVAYAAVEAEGADALSLGNVARTLGVKTPSLYRYVANKAALIEAVNLRTLTLLFEQVDGTLAENFDNAEARLLAVARTLRGFAHLHPHTYQLAMTAPPSQGRPDEALLVSFVLPVQAIMAEHTGEAASLSALRGLFALIHGFAMLELNQQLQRGGDLSETFDETVRAYLRGWT